LDFSGSDNAIFPSSVWVNAYPTSSWDVTFNNYGLCGGGGVSCGIYVQQATQVLLIVVPYYQSQDPISFDMQAVCRFGCAVPGQPPVFTSIRPAAQPAGPDNTVVVSGTGLNFSTPFDLISQDGSQYSQVVPVSANSAGTRLTLRLDTAGVPPGTYDVGPGGSCSPGPCPFWLLNAYTVTKGPAPPRPTRFVPLVPKRILDTRTGHGARRARVPAHGTITFRVDGRSGVPADQVAAVLLDVSAVAPSGAGYLTVYAAGRRRPPAETADFTAGRSATGLVTVPVDNGRVAVYNGSPGPVDLTADILGYETTSPKAGLGFRPVGPRRILKKARVEGWHMLALKVAGIGHLSARAAKAVALDVSVTAPRKAGRVIAYAEGTTRPDVTSLSFAAGQRITELVIARVTDGKVDLYNASGGSIRLTADAVGYYKPTGSAFYPMNSLRVMDTRIGFGGAGEAIFPHAADMLNPLWNILLPPRAVVTAVVLNVTVLRAGSAGALTVFPDGKLYQDGIALPNSTSLPGTPNIDFRPGQSQSNLVIVPTSALADFYNDSHGKIQVVAELEGYYATLVRR
jgi:hypothetical protein